MARFRIQVQIGEIVYNSLEEAARQFGISSITLKKRKEIGGNQIILKKIELQDKLYDVNVSYGGKIYKNASALANELNVKSQMVMFAAKKGNMLFGYIPRLLRGNEKEEGNETPANGI